nr:Cell morphogenesis protein PAG1 [Polyrhizophydium stewartii]
MQALTAQCTQALAWTSSVGSSLNAVKRNAVPIVLQTVFARFVQAAETKVGSLLYVHLDRDEDISAPLKAGADPAFDRLLSSIGSIAKHCPKLIIDSIMVWRKSKGDNIAAPIPDLVRSMYPLLKPKDMETILKERKSLLANFVLCRILTAIISQLGKNTLPNDLGEKLEDMVFGQLRNADPELVVKSVNRQANVDMFAELIGALSNIRFATVSDRFISEIGRGAAVNRESKSELKLELMIRSMRFLKLKASLLNLAAIYPMDCLEETAEFLQTSADLFQNSHNIHVKHAYADVFVELLDPIASVASAEVNLPAWQKTIDTIYPKAAKMAHKSRHLSAVLPLISTLLCVSRKDFFLKNWFDFVNLLIQRFKEKSERDRELKPIALVSLARLIWVYLFRCFESPASTVQRRMDELLRILFAPNRRGVLPTECDLQSFVHIVYFVLVKYPDYGNEAVLANLLGAESLNTLPPVSALTTSLSSHTNADGDMTYNPSRAAELVQNPERLIIALRAFLLFLSDVEVTLGESQGAASTTAGTVSAVQSGAGMVVVEGRINLPSPRFPDHHALRNGAIVGSLEMLIKVSQHTEQPGAAPAPQRPLINGRLDDELLMRMGSSIRETLESVNTIVGRALVFLDQTLGGLLIIDSSAVEVINVSGPISGGTINSSASVSGRRPSITMGESLPNAIYSTIGNISGIAPADKERSGTADILGKDRIHFDLLRVLLESIPRYTPHGLNPLRIIEILSRLMLHLDEGIRAAAFAALTRIARVKETGMQRKFWSALAGNETIAAAVVRISSEVCIAIIGSRFSELWASPGAAQRAVRVFLDCYLAFVQIWMDEFSVVCAEQSVAVLDQQECFWMIEDIEARGLVFLAMSSPVFRDGAIRAFRMADAIEARIDELRAQRDAAAALAAAQAAAAAEAAAAAAGDASFSHEASGIYPAPEEVRKDAQEQNSTLQRLSRLRGGQRNTLERKRPMRGQGHQPHQQQHQQSPPHQGSNHHRASSGSPQSPRQSQKSPPSSPRQARLNMQGQPAGGAAGAANTPQRAVLSSFRIYRIMLECGNDLIKKHYNARFASANARPDFAKTQQQHRRNLAALLAQEDSLFSLAKSDNSHERTVWRLCFPDLLKLFLQHANPVAMQRAMSDMFQRLRSAQSAVAAISDAGTSSTPASTKSSASAAAKWAMERTMSEKRSANAAAGAGSGMAGAGGAGTAVANSASEAIIDEWSFNLVFVAACLRSPDSDAGADAAHHASSHGNSQQHLHAPQQHKRNRSGSAEMASPGTPSTAAAAAGSFFGKRTSAPSDRDGRASSSSSSASLMIHTTAALASAGLLTPSSSLAALTSAYGGSTANLADATPGVPSQSDTGLGSGGILGTSAASVSVSVAATIDNLVQLVSPFLWSENVSIRQAASLALGSVHSSNYRSLILAIQPTIAAVIEDMRVRGSYARNESSRDSGRKTSFGTPASQAQTLSKRFERVRMEVMHILWLIADFVETDSYRVDPAIMTPVLDLTRATMQFLSDAEVQLEWDHHMLRYYFCSFVDRFYVSLSSASKRRPAQQGSSGQTAGAGAPLAHMSAADQLEAVVPFALRLELLQLFERWCGFGRHGDHTREREARMMKNVLDQIKDAPQRGTIIMTMEDQRKALEEASLRAMASLCNGAMASRDNAQLQFDLPRLTAWINAVLESSLSQYHHIARKAIEHVLTHNASNERLTEAFLRECYMASDESRVTLGYFMAFVDLVGRMGSSLPIAPTKILCLALYQISSESAQRRKGAARLLLALERAFFGLGSNTSALAADVRKLFGDGTKLGNGVLDGVDTLDSQQGRTDTDHESGAEEDDEQIEEDILVYEDDDLLLREVQATYESAAITSSLPLVFKYAQRMVSQRLAIERPGMTYEVFPVGMWGDACWMRC